MKNFLIWLATEVGKFISLAFPIVFIFIWRDDLKIGISCALFYLLVSDLRNMMFMNLQINTYKKIKVVDKKDIK